jgi:t-SNARE complex subunit (syntaxin)
MKKYLALSLPLLLAPYLAAAADSKTHQTVDPDVAYKNNCMRCHSALPQYSSRMNQTIMMHMRVAANLPADEAAAILEYLNGESSSSDLKSQTKQDKQDNPQQHEQHTR